MALITLKGNISTAPMNLKTTSSVKPIILKGSDINQTSGRRKIITSASGQQRTKRIHHNKKAIIVLIFKID